MGTIRSLVISQDLYFQLHYDFVNKMYFLFNGISFCGYVRLNFLTPKVVQKEKNNEKRVEKTKKYISTSSRRIAAIFF